MKKVDIVGPRRIKPFSELGRWKKEIRALIEDFHWEDLVHGDLRLANFIFTRARPYRMLLIDSIRVEEWEMLSSLLVNFPRNCWCRMTAWIVASQYDMMIRCLGERLHCWINSLLSAQ